MKLALGLSVAIVLSISFNAASAASADNITTRDVQSSIQVLNADAATTPVTRKRAVPQRTATIAPAGYPEPRAVSAAPTVHITKNGDAHDVRYVLGRKEMRDVRVVCVAADSIPKTCSREPVSGWYLAEGYRRPSFAFATQAFLVRQPRPIALINFTIGRRPSFYPNWPTRPIARQHWGMRRGGRYHGRY